MTPKKKVQYGRFSKIDEKKSKCKLCQKVIMSSGNTTNLIGHIHNVHKAAYSDYFSKQNEPPLVVKTMVCVSDDIHHVPGSQSTTNFDLKPFLLQVILRTYPKSYQIRL